MLDIGLVNRCISSHLTQARSCVSKVKLKKATNRETLTSSTQVEAIPH